jgi:hypothetical protein
MNIGPKQTRICSWKLCNIYRVWLIRKDEYWAEANKKFQLKTVWYLQGVADSDGWLLGPSKQEFPAENCVVSTECGWFGRMDIEPKQTKNSSWKLCNIYRLWLIRTDDIGPKQTRISSWKFCDIYRVWLIRTDGYWAQANKTFQQETVWYLQGVAGPEGWILGPSFTYAGKNFQLETVWYLQDVTDTCGWALSTISI